MQFWVILSKSVHSIGVRLFRVSRSRSSGLEYYYKGLCLLCLWSVRMMAEFFTIIYGNQLSYAIHFILPKRFHTLDQFCPFLNNYDLSRHTKWGVSQQAARILIFNCT